MARKRTQNPTYINHLLAERIERRQKHYEAFGQFIEAFAIVETAMALTLWKYAGVSHRVARAVFSGVRAKEAGDFIKRILEARKAPQAKRNRLKYILDQLGEINSARNDIVHYGIQSVWEGNAVVTNALKAATKSKVTHFSASAEILDNMTADLRKITMHLNYEWLEKPRPAQDSLRMGLDNRVLQAPWKYRPQRQAGMPKVPPLERALRKAHRKWKSRQPRA
jgi:hypothetical protein